MTDLKFIAERQRRLAYDDQDQFYAGVVVGLMLGTTAVGLGWIIWRAGVACMGA